MKKWIALFLAVILALSLCACGKDDSADPTQTPTIAPTDPTTGGNNNGGENNDNNGGIAEDGDFSLLTDILLRNGDGEEAENAKVELEYDANYCIVGAKLYNGGALRSEVVLDKETTHILSQTEYEEGMLSNTHTFTYDANGNELTRVTTNAAGEVTYSKTSTYTAEGWLETTKDNYSWETYTYDEHGNPLTYRSGSGDEVWSNTAYENSYADGRLTEVKVNQDGYPRWSERYDADGNLVEECSYDEDGNIWHRDTFTYENGKLMLRVIFSNGEESFREEYTYNAAGQLTEKRSFDEGHLHGRTVYTYENGSLVNVKLYDHEELEGEYTFSYKKANVSAEQAEKLLALYESIEFD